MNAAGLDVLLHAPRSPERWLQALAAAAPLHRFHLQLPEHPERIRAWVGWAAPLEHFVPMTGLALVLPLGAGVDALVDRPDLRSEVQIVRLVDAGMAEQMVEYALYAALQYQRGFARYREQQARGEWQPLRRRSRGSVQIGVLGLGALGAAVAGELARFGYRVAGWSRSAKSLPGVQCLSGAAGLNDMLRVSEVLIDLLPSTADTRGLLDRQHLALLPAGGQLVLASRGDRYDSRALLECLQSGQLGGAQIDVFAHEPLPANDPLWRCRGVAITPHVAAMTVLEDSVAQIAANLDRFVNGQPLLGLVDRQRGY
ncbi:2-hydroxyacid dehydrogenase [Pseudomarimonas arenosa]|uniref:Glyoxylate/hydroxypyruvate reductase A n=1 Tax=Pseudomarimonas arenosa TaxID=2774145 RepID=A0AAW3ZNU2_9GAMM|nr:glyoxylate/hydroxypyruvate reductase A [Pseudomarimonas arenosa]MBD8526757.1 glyoxylate/hydroxypyruvate reductase A [Pseudomarimonas arenosa]